MVQFLSAMCGSTKMVLGLSFPTKVYFLLQKAEPPFPLHEFKKCEIPPNFPCSPASEMLGRRQEQHQPHIISASNRPSASSTPAPVAPTVTRASQDTWTCLTRAQSIPPLHSPPVPGGGQAGQAVAYFSKSWCGLPLSSIRSGPAEPRGIHPQRYPTSNPMLPRLAAVCPIMSNSYTTW